MGDGQNYSVQCGIRTDQAWLESVDRWRRENPKPDGFTPSRSEAIRALVMRTIEREMRGASP